MFIESKRGAETILLLGGRAPVALELARVLHHAGHRVIGAESMPVSFTAWSRTVARHYPLPPPAQEIEAFGAALAALIRAENITFVLPTCEEIFHVARVRHLLPPDCTYFLPSLESLREVHHKGLFAAQAARYGLAVPETHLLTAPQDLAPFMAESAAWVFKPAYSRFAAYTLIRPTPQKVTAQVHPTPQHPWVAQRFVAGRQICTYSVAQAGRLTAHSAYPTDWTAGQGATIAYRAIEHPASHAWVEAFVAAAQWTGQIAFDFIEQADGTVTVLECNPRATSGVHLLASHPHFARTFFDPTMSCATPAPNANGMMTLAMLLYGTGEAHQTGRWGAWWQALRTYRDVLWRHDDPRPWAAQVAIALLTWGRSLQLGSTLIQATTQDIEWNGDD
jgi:glutathione synthase/RimK-type ligase-like ATP-grasp enzyme